MQRKDFFRIECFACILQAGKNVFMREAGIVPENFRLSPSLRKQINHKLYGNARPFNDRLSHENSRATAIRSLQSIGYLLVSERQTTDSKNTIITANSCRHRNN